MVSKSPKVVELPFAFEHRKQEVQKVAERIARIMGACKFCGSNELTAVVAEHLVQEGFDVDVCPVVYEYGAPVELNLSCSASDARAGLRSDAQSAASRLTCSHYKGDCGSSFQGRPMGLPFSLIPWGAFQRKALVLRDMGVFLRHVLCHLSPL
jgi:hypothetical protein